MVVLRPIHINPSGCQCWRTGNKTLAAGGNHFAYASTLALYIYDINGYKLKRMIAGHDRPITGISLSPHHPESIATISKDGKCSIWNIDSGIRVNVITLTASPPCSIEWSPHSLHEIALGCENGAIYSWNAHPSSSSPSSSTAPVKEMIRHRVPHAAYHLRWNPKQSGLLAVGTVDGHVLIILTANKTVQKMNVAGENGEKGILADMQWDPLSSHYMLVAFRGGRISLWDMEEKTELFTFDRTGTGPSNVAWLPWAAGNFAAVNTRTGVLRVFNVSQKQPIDHIRLGTEGITAFIILPVLGRGMVAFKDGSVGLYDLRKRHMEFLSKAGHTETVFDCAFSPSSPDTLATASYDGSIKIWSVESMKHHGTLLRQEGGIIYSISWSPDGHHLLSSSSKGEVVLWDVHDARVLHTYSLHNGQPVLRVDWCPTDPEIAASCGQDHSCVIFDTSAPTSYRIRHRLRHPHAVYGVRWSPHHHAGGGGGGGGILATGCEDGLIRMYDLSQDVDEPILLIKGHKGKVFSCEWHPMIPGLLASSSDDTTVRLWYIPTFASSSSSSSSFYHVALWEVIGHETAERISKIQESSSSSSSSIITALEVGVLKGHTSRARGLVWNTELPHLLISGSWDFSLRIWDTRTLNCLQIIHEHLADVYGLAQHPHHPFLLVSSSRDTSVRVWLLDDVIGPAKMMTIVDQSFDRVRAGAGGSGGGGQQTGLWWERADDGDYDDDIDRNLLLRGPASREVARRIHHLRKRKESNGVGSSSRGACLIRIYQEMFKFWGGPLGTQALWRHVRRAHQEEQEKKKAKGGVSRANSGGLVDEDDREDDDDDGGGAHDSLYDEDGMILHESDVLEMARQEAAELESIRMFSSLALAKGALSSSASSSSRHTGLKRDERLADAAMIHLQAGRIKQYCELQIELDQWERALAVAPGVGPGLDYWKALCSRYGKHLEEQKLLSEAAVCFYVASDQREKAVDLYIARKEYRKAFLVAKVLEQEWNNGEGGSRGQGGGLLIKDEDAKHVDSRRRKEVITGVAEEKLSMSSTTLDSGERVMEEGGGNVMERRSSKVIDDTEEGGVIRIRSSRNEARAGLLDGPSARACSTRNSSNNSKKTSRRRPLLQVADHMARIHFASGDPIKSACCYLAVGNHVKTIQSLVRGCEIELAYAVSLCLLQEGEGNEEEEKLQLDVSMAVAMRAELKGCIHLALRILWRSYGQDKATIAQRKSMGFLVARSTCLSDDQVNEIYGQLDLRDILASSGSSSSRNGGEGGGGNSKYEDDDDDDDATGYDDCSLLELEKDLERLVLSRQASKAAMVGLHLLGRFFGQADSRSDDVVALERIALSLSSINVYSLNQKMRVCVLAYLSYMAALIGIKKKIWGPIICYLAYNARTMKKTYQLGGKDLVISDTAMLLVEARYAGTPIQLERASTSLEEAINGQSIDNTLDLITAQGLLQQLGNRAENHRQKEKQQTHLESWAKIAAESNTYAFGEDGRGGPLAEEGEGLNRSEGGSLRSLEKNDDARMIIAGPSMITSTITSQRTLFQNTSVLTGLTIEGPAIILEDKTSAIGLNEAYMLIQVYPFSPTNTGDRLKIS